MFNGWCNLQLKEYEKLKGTMIYGALWLFEKPSALIGCLLIFGIIVIRLRDWANNRSARKELMSTAFFSFRLEIMLLFISTGKVLRQLLILLLSDVFYALTFLDSSRVRATKTA